MNINASGMKDPVYTSALNRELPHSDQAHSDSTFRTVFGSEPLKSEFVKFLQTIFYQLDSHKVLGQMGEILADPSKSDEQIYTELTAQIDQMRKGLPSVFYQIQALSVLQKGMGQQAQSLMKDFRGHEFHNYLEVYFRRDHKTLQKTANLALDGKVLDISDKPYEGGLKERLEAGALLSSYPYRDSLPLNDPDCTSAELEPEKTYKPIDDSKIPDNDLDLIGCLGGLHHIPQDRLDPFAQSLYAKLKPGGVVLLREHNAGSKELQALVSVVHSFVNAAAGVTWDAESKKIRLFQSEDYWKKFMERHHFIYVPHPAEVLTDDPTQNGMMAFVKAPQNLEDLKIAAKYRKDSYKTPDSTRATWIEWGNVRYAKQFAEFIQDHHASAFDYIGHLRQHWTHFTNYLTESRRDLSWQQIICSDNFATSLFILLTTTVQCLTSYVGYLPSMAIARCRHGVNWRDATDLTAVERYQAQVEKEYSEFIDHTPAYMFPYLSKIRGLWDGVIRSDESSWVKALSFIDGLSGTLSLLVKAAICAPVRMIYTTSNGQVIQNSQVAVLIKDPLNQITDKGIEIEGQQYPVKVVYGTQDQHKLVLMPSYRPFTAFCKNLPDQVELVEIGSQANITLDVLYKQLEQRLSHDEVEARLIYEMKRLQDPAKRTYATYEVPVGKLAALIERIGKKKVEYIHE